MKDKHHTIKNKQETIITKPNELALAIAHKNISRRFHSLSANQPYFPIKSFVVYEYEFKDFLTQLKSSVARLPKPTRFRLLLGHQKHWSTLDCQIDKNSINFFLIDAAFNLPIVIIHFFILNFYFPKANFYFSSGTMQKDFIHCSIFSLDHSFLLSKMPNLFIHLKKIKKLTDFSNYAIATLFPLDNRALFQKHLEIILQNPLIKSLAADLNLMNLFSKTKQLVEKIQYILIDNFHPSMAALLRATQSLSSLNRFSEKIKKAPISTTKNINLKNLIDYQRRKNGRNDSIQTINHEINLRLAQLKKTDDPITINEIEAYRQGFQYLDLLALSPSRLIDLDTEVDCNANLGNPINLACINKLAKNTNLKFIAYPRKNNAQIIDAVACLPKNISQSEIKTISMLDIPMEIVKDKRNDHYLLLKNINSTLNGLMIYAHFCEKFPKLANHKRLKTYYRDKIKPFHRPKIA